MNEEKRKRITAAVTVSAVLLIFVLIAVVIYQIVEIAVFSVHRNQLRAQYNNYQQELQEGEDWLEKYNGDPDGIMYILALQNGYRPAK